MANPVQHSTSGQSHMTKCQGRGHMDKAEGGLMALRMPWYLSTRRPPGRRSIRYDI